MLRFVPSGVSALAAAALQLSGYHNTALALTLVGLALLLGAAGLLSYVRARRTPAPPMAATKNRDRSGPTMGEKDKQGDTYNIGDVTSHDQSGGITAGVVNISAPQPSVQVVKEAEFDPTDEGYTTRVLVNLEAPYAARNLAIFVEGTGIKATGVNRVDPSASLSTGAITYRGKPGTIVGAPLTNAYRVFVVTERSDAQISVEALLDIDP